MCENKQCIIILKLESFSKMAQQIIIYEIYVPKKNLLRALPIKNNNITNNFQHACNSKILPSYL